VRLTARLSAGFSVLGMSILAACGGGGSGGISNTNPPVIAPAPFPSTTSTPPTGSTLVCRAAGTPQSAGRSIDAGVPRRLPGKRGEAEFVPGILEVVYRSSALLARRAEATQLISSVGGHVRSEMETSATGDRIAHIMASLAQWERRIIGQRTREALAVRKSQGVKLGRPTTMPAEVRARIAA